MKNRGKRDRYVLGESADGNSAITNVKADETKKKREREEGEAHRKRRIFRRHRRCCMCVCVLRYHVCLRAASQRKPRRDTVRMHFKYDAFPVAIKEIMSRANYNNHNIIATCLLHSEFTLPLTDSDSPLSERKCSKITPINCTFDREIRRSIAILSKSARTGP